MRKPKHIEDVFPASWHIRSPFVLSLHLMLWSHRDGPLKSFLLSMKNQSTRRESALTDLLLSAPFRRIKQPSWKPNHITQLNIYPLNCVIQRASGLSVQLKLRQRNISSLRRLEASDKHPPLSPKCALLWRNSAPLLLNICRWKCMFEQQVIRLSLEWSRQAVVMTGKS